MRIRIVAPARESPSFYMVASECMRVFKELGCEVDFQEWDKATVDDAPPNILFIGYAYWGTVAYTQRWLGKSKLVWYSTCEGLPRFDAWTRNMAQDIPIIVPSKFCEAMFKIAEVPTVGMVSHGCDMEAEHDVSYSEALDKYLKGKRLILCVAANDIRKGLDKYLLASKLIQREVGDTFWILHSSHKKLIADMGMRGYFDLDSIIRTLQLDNIWVTDMGGAFTKAQMQSLYRRAYIYAMTSHAEGFGIPMIEAMRWGVPTVAINEQPFNEVVKNMESGMLIPVKSLSWYDYPERYSPRMSFHMKDYSVDEYADALIRLLNEERLREQMSKKIEETKHIFDSRNLYPKLLEYF